MCVYVRDRRRRGRNRQTDILMEGEGGKREKSENRTILLHHTCT